MLSDDDPEVRFAAASHLLSRGDVGAAIAVLEALQSESSLIGPTARLRLMTWRRDAR
jgi:HEAT repeat protein